MVRVHGRAVREFTSRGHSLPSIFSKTTLRSIIIVYSFVHFCATLGEKERKGIGDGKRPKTPILQLINLFIQHQRFTSRLLISFRNPLAFFVDYSSVQRSSYCGTIYLLLFFFFFLLRFRRTHSTWRSGCGCLLPKPNLGFHPILTISVGFANFDEQNSCVLFVSEELPE